MKNEAKKISKDIIKTASLSNKELIEAATKAAKEQVLKDIKRTI